MPTAKRVQVTTLTSDEANKRKTQDTLTRQGVGLSNGGNYVTDEGTNYLQAADMAGYDTNSVMTAAHIIDSLIYKINTSIALFDTGAVGTATVRKSLSNYATGVNSFAINGNNYATGVNSFAHGSRAVSYRPYSDATSSGKITTIGDAQGLNYVLKGTTIGATTDTLEFSTGSYPVLGTDLLTKLTFDLVAVIDTGTAVTLKVGDGMTQLWQVSAYNDAGTTTLISTADSSTAKRTDPTLASYVTVVVSDATESIYIIVHGVHATFKMKWVAYVKETQVGFRNFTLGY
jgi:hypothetical protein